MPAEAEAEMEAFLQVSFLNQLLMDKLPSNGQSRNREERKNTLLKLPCAFDQGLGPPAMRPRGDLLQPVAVDHTGNLSGMWTGVVTI
jgi:hypothetical protein